MSYDKLCIATGTKARVPMVYKDAVETIENVFTIRNAEDHTRLR